MLSALPFVLLLPEKRIYALPARVQSRAKALGVFPSDLHKYLHTFTFGKINYFIMNNLLAY
jgi:hypothetical protein